MDLEEILKSQGIGQEKIGAVLTQMKENRVFTASEENLDVRYSKLNEKYTTLQTDLDTANTQISTLSAEKGSLQTKVSDLTKKDTSDQIEGWKKSISEETGVPAEVLVGDTEEAIKKHAEACKAHFKTAPVVGGDGHQPNPADGTSEKREAVRQLFGKE